MTLSYPSSPPLPYVVFAVFQTGRLANGGVESITQIIERCRQIKPIVITQRETAATQRWRSAGAIVEVWEIADPSDGDASPATLDRPRSAWRWFLSHWRTNQRMYRLLRSLPASILHCNDHRTLWQTGLGAKLAGAQVIFNIRDIKAPDKTYDWRWRLASRLSDRQLLLSQEMRQQWIDRLQIAAADQSRVSAIYSVVDPTRFYPLNFALNPAGNAAIDPPNSARSQLRSALNIPEPAIAIGYIATFSPKKAQLAFLEQAAPRLIQALPDTHLYFVGDFEPDRHPYARACLDTVQRLGLERSVTFVGFTSQAARWYQALDLTIVASDHEGLARCMIESLACGTPVISFKVCSAREILEQHQCGAVVPQGDYAALVQAIVQFVQDPALRARWRQSGMQTARRLFQPQPIVEQYEALYLSLAHPTAGEHGPQSTPELMALPRSGDQPSTTNLTSY